MRYALIENIKSEAIPNARGICPHCKLEVHSKCGEYKSHHWAHLSNRDCDKWQYPETEWHINWKKKFGSKFSEIKIEKQNIYHIADVKNKNGLVIEFQNSSITIKDIRKRELFYKKMIWVINGTRFHKRFDISKETYFFEKIIPENFFYKPHKVYIDIWVFDILVKEKYKNRIIKLLDRHGFIYDYELNSFIITYKNSNTNWSPNLLAELHRINQIFGKKLLKNNEYNFEWKYASQPFRNAKKPIFIDFQDGYLYWIKEWKSNKCGILKKITINQFLKKYR